MKVEEPAQIVAEPPVKKTRPSRKAAAKKTFVKDEGADETEAETLESPKPVAKSKRSQRPKNGEAANAKEKVGRRGKKVPEAEVR